MRNTVQTGRSNCYSDIEKALFPTIFNSNTEHKCSGLMSAFVRLDTTRTANVNAMDGPHLLYRFLSSLTIGLKCHTIIIVLLCIVKSLRNNILLHISLRLYETLEEKLAIWGYMIPRLSCYAIILLALNAPCSAQKWKSGDSTHYLLVCLDFNIMK